MFSTDQYLSSEKKDYYDGSIVLRPTRTPNTHCWLNEVQEMLSVMFQLRLNVIVVLQTHDQQPLVAGIS